MEWLKVTQKLCMTRYIILEVIGIRVSVLGFPLFPKTKVRKF